MAHGVTNITDRQPAAEQATHNLPPPEVAVARPHPRRKDWALHAMGLGTIFAICYFAEQTLAVILVSVLIAFVLAPLVDLLVRIKFPRPLAAGVAVVLLFGALLGIVYFGFNQASNLIDQIPNYSATIRDEISKLSRKAEKIQALNPTREKGVVNVRQTTSWTDLLTSRFSSISELVLAASFIPFLVFFMLTWQEHVRKATVGLFPLEHRREAYATLGLISRMIRSFMVGNLLIALAIGGVSTAVFGILHVPFFFFAGFASGFLSLVPYLGIVLALLPPVFLGLGQISLAAMGWIALTSLTLHIVAMNVLYPKVLGKRLSLNPLALTIALLVWAWLWGAAGLLLAVPITAGMKVVFDHVESLKPFGAWLGEEDGGNGNGNGTGNSQR